MKNIFPLFLLPVFLFAQSPDVPENPHEQLARAKQNILAQRQQMRKSVSTTDYGHYDVQYYSLDLTFHQSTETISGTVEMRAKNLGGSQSTIAMDLADNMSVTNVTGDHSGYTHTNERINMEFDPPLTAGQEFTVVVHYNGSPVVAGFQGLTFENHSQGPIISSLSEPYFARTWWPCKDVPADKADSADIRITSSNDLIPVSNGSLESITQTTDSTHTYHWKVHYPIVNYLISVAISNYTNLTDTYVAMNGDSMLLDYYLYPQETNYSYITENVDETRQMIEVFAELFGEYPFLEEKYGMASFNWGGAMEHQTISSMGSYSRMIIVHELAHQWWGDMVTTHNWHHIWLNEGFASYAEALYLEAIQGEDAYHNYMASMAYRGNGTIYVEDTTSVYGIFNGNLSYDKAGYVLHMLRHVVGDSTFFEGLSAYRDAYYMSTATTEDFQQVMEQVSGQDLSAFFQQWIYSQGPPNYDYCLWTEAAGDSTEAFICVHQTQDREYPYIFKMPLDIQLTDSLGNDTTFVVQNDERDAVYSVMLDWAPTDIELDPDDWVLKTANQVPANIVRDGCEFLTEFNLAPNYPNPFNSRTKLVFTVPITQFVTGEIYDITGRKVKTLFAKELPPGQYTSYYWDATNDMGQTVSSGVYIFRLQYENHVKSRKMIFIK